MNALAALLKSERCHAVRWTKAYVVTSNSLCHCVLNILIQFRLLSLRFASSSASVYLKDKRA
jgi:hypothetical protein